MSSLTSPADSSLVRAINELPTTDLAALAGVHHSPRHHSSSLRHHRHHRHHSPRHHRHHTYSTSSLRHRSTSSLLREVGGGSSSLGGGMSSMGTSSMAMSLGQCAPNYVIDPKTGKCIHVHSHRVSHHALKHALAVANAKADGLM